MPPWFSFLTHIAGVYEHFDFSRHSGPIVSGTDSIVSLKISSMHCFSYDIMRFLHYFDAKILMDTEVSISYGVLENI